ncbi:MAG: alpha/beta fold hydrolase [Acidimicrobiia bacterium]
MTIAITISLLVILVVLAHLVGGWFYANGFRESALHVQPPNRTFGVWVRSVDKRKITLTAGEPRQDIGHPGTLGLFWEGGYGQIGPVIGVEGLDITRKYTQLEGVAPPMCPDGTLETCPPVDLEGYAYPSDPSDVDLEFEEVSYQSPLGPIGAWVIPADGAGTWAIHIHGWTAERREAIRLLPSFHRAGATSLVVDYRNDPGMPQDPTGRYRFGLSEWEDVEGAVRYALDHGAVDIVLVGYSTGAAHVMSFLERSDLAARVQGVVLDSPNILLAEAIRYGSQDQRFSGTNIKISRLVTEFGMWIADLRWKIDWETTNYVQRAATILTVPTLVFHGTSDQRVPISVSRQLEAHAPGVVTLVETRAAGHVMSWNADPKRYERYLESFLRKIQN